MENENVESTAVQEVQEVPAPAVVPQANVVAGFGTEAGFILLQRMAKMFSYSTLVPEAYQTHYDSKGNPTLTGMSNCIIALNMAQRMNADPLMVIQNLYIVHNQPAWSSKFMIATFNKCGRYTSIRYKETGVKGTDSQGIIAYATELATGETLEGPNVTIEIAKKEKWYDKPGSKWKTMPDQMLRYRAAAWFIRTTAPELSMGLQTYDEVVDVNGDKEAESIYERTLPPKEEPVTIEAEEMPEGTVVAAVPRPSATKAAQGVLLTEDA